MTLTVVEAVLLLASLSISLAPTDAVLLIQPVWVGVTTRVTIAVPE
jgi:hypothetical protein